VGKNSGHLGVATLYIILMNSHESLKSHSTSLNIIVRINFVQKIERRIV